jgi:hypothetical protein
MKLLAFLLPCALAVSLSPAPALPGQAATQDGWRVFEGSWSAAGQRQSLETEAGRPASTIYLSGAVVITGEGIGRGFRGEVIGFDDGGKASLGRSVWTDERGDRIFSTLSGQGMGTGRRFAGTITGGTGRYAGITGDYSFEWQYVVAAEQGAIQGRAVGLKGRFRTGGAGQ